MSTIWTFREEAKILKPNTPLQRLNTLRITYKHLKLNDVICGIPTNNLRRFTSTLNILALRLSILITYIPTSGLAA